MSKRATNVWSLDCATVTGFAIGRPPAHPARLVSGSVRLLAPETDDVAEVVGMKAFALQQFLEKRLQQETLFSDDGWPDVIVYEAPMDPNAEHRDGRRRGAQAIALPWALASAVYAFAAPNDIRVVKVYPQTVRASFLKRAHAGFRDNTKARVIDVCKMWGYLPVECKDDNRADAVAGWHWMQTAREGWLPPFEIFMGKPVKISDRIGG